MYKMTKNDLKWPELTQKRLTMATKMVKNDPSFIKYVKCHTLVRIDPNQPKMGPDWQI